MRKLINLQTGASAGALLGLLLVACGDDSSVQPYPSTSSKGGASGAAGAAGASGAAGKGSAGKAGTGGATGAGTGGSGGVTAGGGGSSAGSSGASVGGGAGAAGTTGIGGSTTSGGAAGSAEAGSGGAAGQGQAGATTGGAAGSTAGGAAGSGTVCSAPQTACDAACVDLKTDPKNCGTCNTLCAIGASCVDGQCALQCAAGLTACGDACVDTLSSTRNCGQCGITCAQGQVCNNGTCGSSCASDKTSCTGLGGVTECVDVLSDEAHCGTCSKECALGQVCNAGVCELSCTGGSTKCNDVCVDQATDAKNCGGCGVLCVGSETCSSGECKIVCAAGESICGGKCVDKASDEVNCGSCGNTCASGQACVEGACKVVCAAGQSACGNTCFDLQTSGANCGSCGNACGSTQVCDSGVCKLTCALGQTTCSGSCVDLTSDLSNCGACGTQCATGASCGPAGCACPAGQAACGGACVDTKADEKNCGACGVSCGVDETCRAGACTATCESQLKGNPLRDRWGYVWDGLERTTATFAAAETTCTGIGGRLPTATEIHRASAARTSDVGQLGQNNYLWTNVPYAPTVQISARLSDGITTNAAVAANQTFRCVCAPPPSPGYGGADCIGSAKPECAEFQREGKTYLIDKNDRAMLPAGAAEWECQFSGGTMPTADVYVDLMTRASGIGSGNNAWHHTADQSRYNTDTLVGWGAEGSWAPSTSTFSYSAFETPRTFRCMGPKGAVPAKSPVATTVGAFVIPNTGLALDAANRAGATFQGALDTCAALGGHLPTTNDMFGGIAAGLGGGSNTWLWTADETGFDTVNFTIGVMSWVGTAPRFQYVHTGLQGGLTWAYKHDARLYSFRCGYPAVDAAYTGPTAAQCNVVPCQKFQSGEAGSGATWMDKIDRASVTWQAAVGACQKAGGRLASERDYAEAVRQGLPGGSGAYIWTSDTSGYQDVPYAYAHVVKWSGTAQSFDDTYSQYMTWSYPTNSHPYRCSFTNEYRLARIAPRKARSTGRAFRILCA